MKYQAELDGLKEGVRVVMKNRVLKEWRQAKFRKAQMAKENETLFDEVELDTKHIEFEIDRTIQ